MKRLTILIVLLLAAFGTNLVSAQTDTDIENLYNAVNALETKPLEKETQKLREKALLWVIETDKVSVTACGGVIKPFLNKKNKYGSELMVTYTLAMAAFKLRNPENKNDGDAQLAGIESALKAYEKMLSEKPKAKFEAMDDLVVKRDNGELATHVTDNDCG